MPHIHKKYSYSFDKLTQELADLRPNTVLKTQHSNTTNPHQPLPQKSARPQSSPDSSRQNQQSRKNNVIVYGISDVLLICQDCSTSKMIWMQPLHSLTKSMRILAEHPSNNVLDFACLLACMCACLLACVLCLHALVCGCG